MTTDPRAAERAEVDAIDWADVDLKLEPYRPPPLLTFALRLDVKTIRRLREVSRRQQKRPTQLVREWIVERLEAEDR